MPDLVITLIGPDRPGVVESVAEPIAAHGGSWLESRMAHLAGMFAGILRVEVPAENVGALTATLGGLAQSGLRVVVEESHPELSAPAQQQLMDLDLLGTDRPGIVREISRLLAAHGVNIEELATDRTAAPMSGEMLFRARARVRVPAGADMPGLRSRLEKLASDLMVEATLVEERPEDGR
jgi:glycine cleavage system regulatory protein